VSTTTTISAEPDVAAGKAQKSRTFPFLGFLLILCVVSLAVPAVFQFVVAQALSLEMWRRGGSVAITRVEGSLWEPVRLVRTRWFIPSPTGISLRLEADSVEVKTSWRGLLQRGERRWLDRIIVSDIRGKLELAPPPDSSFSLEERRKASAWHFPNSVEIRNLDLMIVAGKDFVRFNGAQLSLDQVEPGTIEIGQLTVRQPWLTRTFRGVQATTSVKGDTVMIADAQLEPGFVIRTLSAELPRIAEGIIDATMLLEAFGGEIRGQAKTLPADRNASVEVSGRFANIGLAQFASFLSVSEAAGGTIIDGYFNFRGSPRNLPKASASLRVNAKNFQWESRQWDSLVLGATLHDRNVQIPELELHQGQNRLSLNGHMELPEPDKQWWQSEFSFNIAAKIDNLTELSALVLPEFRFAAGRMNVDGAVRGKNQQFNGALIVSGSGITWRNAPIDELHAALKVTGNELQVANFEVVNGDDYVRGRGVVNILGAKQYWGELRASIEELGTYQSLLQRPIVPEPLAGGGTITWSGEGSARGHSGLFSARLRKLRTLGATGSFIHPLRADLEGVYSPGSMQFSRFALSDEECAFSANVAIAGRSVTLQELQLTRGDEVWLSGDATLPLDLWGTWPETSIGKLLVDEIPGKLNLVAKNLQLREASRLTGWKWPLEGVVSGHLTAAGALGHLKSSGTISLREGRIPLGDNALTSVSADFEFKEQSLVVAGFDCQHPSGRYRAAGGIDFTNPRDASLKLAVKSDEATFQAFVRDDLRKAPAEPASSSFLPDGYLPIKTSVDVRIDGPASAAKVSGVLKVQELPISAPVDTESVWRREPLPELPPIFTAKRSPYTSWELEITADAAEAPTGALGSKLTGSLLIKGRGAAPFLSGTISLGGGVLVAGVQPLNLHEASFTFREGADRTSSIDARVSASAFDGEVSASICGPLSAPLIVFEAIPPLSAEIAELVMTDRLHRDPLTTERLEMSAPPELRGDASVFEWSIIPAPVPDISAEDASAQAAALPSPTAPSEAVPGVESAPPAAGTNPNP
jgi:hypothetical protein